MLLAEPLNNPYAKSIIDGLLGKRAYLDIEGSNRASLPGQVAETQGLPTPYQPSLREQSLDYAEGVRDRALDPSSSELFQRFAKLGDPTQNLTEGEFNEIIGDVLGGSILSVGKKVVGDLSNKILKNTDAKRAVDFMEKHEVSIVNPATGKDIDLADPSLSDMAQLRNYGKALKNDGFEARETIRAAGKHETLLDTSGQVSHTAKDFDVEDLSGSVVVPLMSDRTTRGVKIDQIGGVPLSKSVYTEGGAGFAADPQHIDQGVGYASTLGAAQGIQNRGTRAAEKTRRPLIFAWGAMGDEAFDFAHFPMEAVWDEFNTLKPYLPKGLLSEFDADVRQLANVRPSGNVPYPNADKWAGLLSESAEDQLLGSHTGAGAMRKAVLDRMKLPKYQYRGMPHYGDLSGAVNDPRFKDAALGDVGAVFIKGEPGASLLDVGHGTYPKGIPGEYLGGLNDLIPAEVFYRDILHGGAYTHPRHRALSTNDSYQIMTDEILDEILRYQQSLR